MPHVQAANYWRSCNGEVDKKKKTLCTKRKGSREQAKSAHSVPSNGSHTSGLSR